MCGIFGFYGTDWDEEGLRAGAEGMIHRGPDDGGAWDGRGSGAPVGLAHRRLSIIDLSAAGRQPIANEDGTVVLSLNGEIYNHRDLRRRLEGRGHVFRSRTDSEAVVHLWEERGIQALDELEGMFAFALWDGRTRTLVLARDRAGEKPLFLRRWNGTLAFASELSPLLAIRGWPRPEVSPQALHAYLTLSYVPGPGTFYEGVSRLPPGSVLTVTESGENHTRYWERPAACPDGLLANPAEARAELRAALAGAVDGMMEADVPLGLLLSGGLDSSVLLSLAARAGRPIRTFAVVFGKDGGAFDERDHARRAARHFGAHHTEVEVDPAGSVGEVSRLVGHFGQPFGLQAFLVAYLVSRAAREHVKVALTGVGGDELFGGYPRYQLFPTAAAWDLVPRPVRSLAARIGPPLVARLPAGTLSSRLERFLRVGDQPVMDRYLGTLRSVEDRVVRSLLAPAFRDPVGTATGLEAIEEELASYARRCPGQSGAAALGEAALYADQGPWLADCLLEYNDRTSMAVGLELRSPFLAREVMELAGRIPFPWKVGLAGRKRILVGAFRRDLPWRNVVRRKAGFGAPTDTWLRGAWRPYMRHVLSRERIGPLPWVDFEAVDEVRRRFEGGDSRLGRLVFSLVVLGEWHEQLGR